MEMAILEAGEWEDGWTGIAWSSAWWMLVNVKTLFSVPDQAPGARTTTLKQVESTSSDVLGLLSNLFLVWRLAKRCSHACLPSVTPAT